MKTDEIGQSHWTFVATNANQEKTIYQVVLSFKVEKFGKTYCVYHPLLSEIDEENVFEFATIDWSEGKFKLLPVEDEVEVEIIKQIISNELINPI